tara:strand:- start:296 stop:652 length:357 start_codon:yes stop_codon:yes gene_type:complete
MLQTIKKQTMKLKMIDCKYCDNQMPELRLTQYGYDFCIECSKNGDRVKRKQGVNIMMGEGDHTWVETVLMTDEQFKQYERQQQAEVNLDKTNKAEMIDMDKGERNLIGPLTIKDENGK